MFAGLPMHQALLALGIGVVTFVSTNVDSAIVLTPALWIQGGPGARPRYIAGCSAGNAVVLAVAVLAAAGLTGLPGRWTMWLGVVPIVVGLLSIRHAPPDAPHLRVIPGPRTGLIVTCSMGFDNVLVLAPVIRSFGWAGGIVVLVHLLLFPPALLLLARARPTWVTRTAHPSTAGYLTILAGVLLIGRQLV